MEISFQLNFSNNKVCRLVPYPTYSNIEIPWMMAGNLFSKTQMWAGWNTLRYHEPTRKHAEYQKTCHMKNIRLPTSREDVLKETSNHR